MANTNIAVIDAQKPMTSATTLAVSAEHIAQFSALLNSTKGLASTSQSSLERKEDVHQAVGEGVLEQQVYKVQESELFIDRLQRHIKGSIDDLRTGHTMDGAFAQSVANLTFASSYYFLGTSRVANTAQDISDEVTAVTRGK